MATLPDPIDHRIAADQLMRQGYSISGEPSATEHLLAAIHDLLAERLPTKGDPCPCGCRRTVEPKPEVSEYRSCLPSLGDRCGNCHRCTDPEPEAMTIRAREAAAWDEGFDAGRADALDMGPEWPDQLTNPYRQEADDDRD